MLWGQSMWCKIFFISYYCIYHFIRYENPFFLNKFDRWPDNYLLCVILNNWFQAIVNLQPCRRVFLSRFCCSVYFSSHLATRFCVVWHYHRVVTKRKCSDSPWDAVAVYFLSRTLCVRPVGYGGPHDVHHGLPVDGQSGPRGLEASVVGLQLVLHVSPNLHKNFPTTPFPLLHGHYHCYKLLEWVNIIVGELHISLKKALIAFNRIKDFCFKGKKTTDDNF